HVGGPRKGVLAEYAVDIDRKGMAHDQQCHDGDENRHHPTWNEAEFRAVGVQIGLPLLGNKGAGIRRPCRPPLSSGGTCWPWRWTTPEDCGGLQLLRSWKPSTCTSSMWLTRTPTRPSVLIFPLG